MPTANPHTQPRQISPEQMPLVADAIGDSPETVISHDVLVTGQCNAWVTGSLYQPRAVMIQPFAAPAEPNAIGYLPADMLALLRLVDGWTCVQVPIHLARELERPVAELRDTLSLNTLEDVYHVLDGPPRSVAARDDVRLLGADERASLAAEGGGGDAEGAAAIVAAGFVEGDIVSIAHAFASSPRYVDIGVSTHEQFRGQGFASAAAALVAAEIQASGRIPVWSTGATNVASLATARKLGFRETSRRMYLIPSPPT